MAQWVGQKRSNPRVVDWSSNLGHIYFEILNQKLYQKPKYIEKSLYSA